MSGSFLPPWISPPSSLHLWHWQESDPVNFKKSCSRCLRILKRPSSEPWTMKTRYLFFQTDEVIVWKFACVILKESFKNFKGTSPACQFKVTANRYLDPIQLAISRALLKLGKVTGLAQRTAQRLQWVKQVFGAPSAQKMVFQTRLAELEGVKLGHAGLALGQKWRVSLWAERHAKLIHIWYRYLSKAP